jgi:D-alanyl-D-alanine dipeptidase
MSNFIVRAAAAASLAVALPRFLPAFAQGLPAGFVRVADVAPGILQDVRYAGSNNFTGRPVPGYGAAECWLDRRAAAALALVQADAQRRGLKLILWDCYRPQRATDAFVRWAADPADQTMKAQFYPAVDKHTLFSGGYIGRFSAHSTGTAVDLGLANADGTVLDFGSPFDLFDPKSATASKAVPAAAQANRNLLRTMMQAHGFQNYAREWWHYTFTSVGKLSAQDIPIVAK